MTAHLSRGRIGRIVRVARIGHLFVASLAAAILLVLVAPVLAPAIGSGRASVASAHSQLISTIPGTDERLTVAPSDVRLVFSESLTPGYTAIEVLDASGAVVVPSGGAIDPADDRGFIAPLPGLRDGTYTVNWYALSGADGHVTQGTFAFTVATGSGPSPSASPGSSASPGAGSVGGSGAGSGAAGSTLHGGHDAAEAAVEVQGKTLAYGGVMLAFGLALVAWGVLRPAMGGRPPGVFVLGVGVANLAAALGVGLLIVVGVASLPTTGAGPPDAGPFLFGRRPGQLLLGRLVVAAVAGALAIAMARSGRRGAALAVGGVGGAIGIGLVAVSGHAIAFDSPIPVVADAVHVGAAGLWLSGLVSLAVLSDFGGRFDPPTLREVVPRFTALALVSVALMAAAGLYATWIQTRDLVSTATPYAVNLDIKVALVAFALVIGAVNYLDAGRDLPRLGGLSRRILVETILAVGVVVVTANLTSGSPSTEDRAVAVAPEASAQPSADIDLAIQPGRPGPNRFIASSGGQPAPAGATVTLTLQPTRTPAGGPAEKPVTIALRPSTLAGVVTYVADANVIGPNSAWEATISVLDVAGSDIGSRRFAFALDGEAITAGRALPPIDPPIVIGLALVMTSLGGVALAISGRTPARVPAGWARLVLLSGGGLGTALGVLIALGGSVR